MPSNFGEFGKQEDTWSRLFNENTFVEAYESSPKPASRAVPVFFRSDMMRRIIDEAQTYHVFDALSTPGFASNGATPSFLDTMGSFADLAFGISDPSVMTGIRFLRASEVISGADGIIGFQQVLADMRKPAAQRPEYLSSDPVAVFGNSAEKQAAAINQQLTMFQLYNGIGVRNRNSKIRAKRATEDSDPDVITLKTTDLMIGSEDNGKIFEFAEPLHAHLPTLGSGDGGFEIWVYYMPDPRPEPAALAGDPALQHQLAERGSAVTIYDGTRAVGNVSEFSMVRVRWTGSEWSLRGSETIEFHEAISALGSSPILLRRLGLIFDFNVPVSEIFSNTTGRFEGRIRVVPDLHDKRCHSSWPWTAFSAGDVSVPADGRAGLPPILSFQPRLGYSASEPLIAGFRRMTDTGQSLYEITASTLKVFADARRRSDDRKRGKPRFTPEPGTPRSAFNAGIIKDVGLAPDFDLRGRPTALRTTGITVSAGDEAYRLDRALERRTKKETDFATSIKNSGVALAFAASADDNLFFEDMLAGYVADVNDRVRWKSLCRRQQSYWFDRGRSGIPDELPDFVAPQDEGLIGLGVDKKVDEDGTIHLKITDNLFNWDGYSLVIPRPGEPVPEINSARPLGSRPTIPHTDDLPVRIVSRVVPQSIAKLRYRMVLQFRARTADLAGNAWRPAEADRIFEHLMQTDRPTADALQTSPFAFLRYDPINPPVIMPLQKPGPSDLGASTDVSGLSEATPSAGRSPEGASVLAIRSGVDRVQNHCRWLFAAPEINLMQAEWAGLLDIFSGPSEAYSILRTRYATALDPNLYDRVLQKLRWPGTSLLSTPYIPDIHAMGVALNYLPGRERPKNSVAILENDISKTVTKVHFATDDHGPAKGKPFSQPFILALSSGPRAARYNASTRMLDVKLPAGEQQLVSFSCYPDPSRLEDFGLFAAATSASGSTLVLQASLPKVADKSIRSSFEAGLVSSVTPSSLLRLVHAIPRPLYAPSFTEGVSVTPRRTFGKAVLLEDTLKTHRASTSNIEIEASWTEYQDFQGSAWPATSPGHLQPPVSVTVDLPDLTILPDASHETLQLKIRHDFPDTKYRKVKYRMRATTRYRDYFDSVFTSNPNNITSVSEFSRDLDILNTAPPDRPVVEYILPTFTWADSESRHPIRKKTRARRSGLRMYLRRPWPSSGEGEVVAILLKPATAPTTTTPDHQPTPAFSEIGADPIRIDAGVSRRYLAFEDFTISRTENKVSNCIAFDQPPKILPSVQPAPDASGAIPLVEDRQITYSDDGLSTAKPEGFTEISYDAAVFDVGYDDEKGLMFADIDIERREEYFPFVRFLVARYQPRSAPYAFLSPPAVADFVQIAPERVLTIIRESVPGLRGGHEVLTLRLVGPVHGDPDKGSLLNEVEMVAVRGTGIESKLHDFVHLPLSVDLAKIQEDGHELVQWIAQVELSRIDGCSGIQISEYEVYKSRSAPDEGSQNVGHDRRAVYLTTVPIW
ncbi:hypothetical protein B5V01_33920 [Mesorhizobium erdmanii]|uniref:Uncharacterized protein n=1 Tax=Mesorhizobium erdmanii TaxID=1777866 RepID=A0A4Q1UH06_9HYPH|nr:hypothetical protein B5V01_33920 [Mesorhizobium erdmanii]